MGVSGDSQLSEGNNCYNSNKNSNKANLTLLMIYSSLKF